MTATGEGRGSVGTYSGAKKGVKVKPDRNENKKEKAEI